MSCHNCGAGTQFRQDYCSEDCALQAHDEAHEDPLKEWGECDTCAGIIQGDIEDGRRCLHGELIPWRRDAKYKSIETDVECPYCQIDYGPHIYAFTGQWNRMIEHELKEETHAA